MQGIILRCSGEGTRLATVKTILDLGVLGCSDYLIWAGLMGREDRMEDHSPYLGRTPGCVDNKIGVRMYCFLPCKPTMYPYGVYINRRVRSIEIIRIHID